MNEIPDEKRQENSGESTAAKTKIVFSYIVVFAAVVLTGMIVVIPASLGPAIGNIFANVVSAL